MPTGPLCLPATGLDGGSIAIVALIAVAIIAVGILALRRNKAAVALLLVPVAVLALALGGTAAPAQALNTAIPSFTVSENWTDEGGPVYFSDPASPENLANLGILDDLVLDEEDVIFSLTLTDEDGTETVALDPSEASASVSDGVADVQADAVDLAQDELAQPYGNLTLTYAITIPYLDDCGNPLSTTVTWTGTVLFLAPVP